MCTRGGSRSRRPEGPASPRPSHLTRSVLPLKKPAFRARLAVARPHDVFTWSSQPNDLATLEWAWNLALPCSGTAGACVAAAPADAPRQPERPGDSLVRQVAWGGARLDCDRGGRYDDPPLRRRRHNVAGRGMHLRNLHPRIGAGNGRCLGCGHLLWDRTEEASEAALPRREIRARPRPVSSSLATEPLPGAGRGGAVRRFARADPADVRGSNRFCARCRS